MTHDSNQSPIALFQCWHSEAVDKLGQNADAMVLSTVSRELKPSSRVVLFKGLRNGAFTFFTNYRSRKGLELFENTFAALLFHWAPLGKQVRIEGPTEPVSAVESDIYWNSRPRESQLSGFVSEQSRPIPTLDFLKKGLETARERFRHKDIPRPEHWGGLRLIPDQFEFWVERENRLHDRTLYRRTQEGWKVDVIAP